MSHNKEEGHANSSETRLEPQTVVVPQEIIAEPLSSPSSSNGVESNTNDETENKAKEEEEEEAKQEEHHTVTTVVEGENSDVIVNETIEEENASDELQQYDEEGGDELPYDYETNYYDWISHISRPRSYWEDRRQAWYKEILDAATSDKGEIRQLLERYPSFIFLSYYLHIKP